MQRPTDISLINLLNDQKIRSLILQTVTLILVLLLVFLILQNITVNLASVGKEFSFGFLNYPAGYDITFQPFIPRKWFQNHFVAVIHLYQMVLEPPPEDKWLRSYGVNKLDYNNVYRDTIIVRDPQVFVILKLHFFEGNG